MYLRLYNAATVVPMPKKVLVQLKKYVQLALNVTSLMVSLVGPSKSVHGEGRELINRCGASGQRNSFSTLLH